MILPAYILVATILPSQSTALPGGDEGSHRGRGWTGASRGHDSAEGGNGVGRFSSGFGTGAVLSGLTENSPSSSTPEHISRSLRNQRDSTSSRESASSTANDSTANNYNQPFENFTGIYTIANITIHQYPVITSSLNEGNLPFFNEDITLWVFSTDKGNPVTSTAAQCNLTCPATAAISSGPPAKHQMRCVNEGADGRNNDLPNYSPKYNVTFQQLTESPLSGFDLAVSR